MGKLAKKFASPRSGLVRNDAPQKLVSLTCNLLPNNCRFDTLEGREYIVVPMVMLTEGVHNGSEGPLLYPKEELRKTPASWNHKPVVVYHPEMNGQGISACEPVVLESRKVGIMLNTKWDKNRLRSEAWIDKEKVNRVDERILAAVESNEMMELSTGLFKDLDPEPGDWNGEPYLGVARNYRPDHLALLPDKIGACSISDGAGFLRNEAAQSDLSPAKRKQLTKIYQKALERVTGNEMSHSNIRDGLSTALRERLNASLENGPFLFVEDVYSNFVIYEFDAKLYRLGYTSSDTGVSLSDEAPVEVKRVFEYRTVNGAFVGNRENNNHEPPMNEEQKKKELIDKIVGNAGWTEDNRKTLMTFNLEQLGTIQLGISPPKPEPAKPDPKPEPKPETVTGNTEPIKPKIETVDDYVAAAPREIQDVLRNGVAAYNEEKNKLVEAITNHKRNEFSREELNNKPLGELKRLARFIIEEQPRTTVNYAGQAPVPTGNDVEEPLEVPSYNSSKAA